MLGDTWEFDLASGTWTEVMPGPAHNIAPPRDYSTAVILGDQMYSTAAIRRGATDCGGIAGMHVLPPGGPRTAYLVTVMVFVTVAIVAPVPVLVNRPVMVTWVGVLTERVVARNGALS